MSEQTAHHKEIITEAKARFARCVEREATARSRGDFDEKFANADSVNGYQWDTKMASDRSIEGRPSLTINKVQQHNLQVINDARQNKASVSIRPVGGGATYQSAQCMMGLVRHVEYQSNATSAYEKAFSDQVNVGIGYWTIETDYVDADSFDQEIYIRRVSNWRSVYLDPDIQEYDGSDANFGFISTDMPNDQFEAKHGKKSLGTQGLVAPGDAWNTKDHTRVAKYYRRSMKPDTLFYTDEGATIRASECAGTEMLTQLRDAVKRKQMKSRKVLSPEIEIFLIAGDEVIEESDWAGSYIPIVRVVGIETDIDGVLDRRGHTRAMIDPQRMYNYWSSCAVEFGALQTKAPFIGAAESIEGREEEWAQANTSNPAVLTYNGFDEQSRPLPKPERAQPPVASSAYTQGMQTAATELMSVSGQYQAELGMPGNEKSGVAIGARQRQSNTATYHFTDHQAMSIRYCGKILVDLFPKIYDTKRVIRILAEDGSDVEATIDPDHPEAHALTPHQGQQAPTSDNVFTAAQKAALVFNPGVGRYDVQADVGPNFGTQREEAFQAFSQIVSQNHDLINVVGDIMFRNADFPGAVEIAERLKEAREGSTVPAAHMQQAQQQMQQMHATMVQLTESLADEKRKTGSTAASNSIAEYNAETTRMATVAKIDPAALLPVVRQMVSDLLGQDAMPLIALHQQHNAGMTPSADTGPDQMAMAAQDHQQAMDKANLGLAASAQNHDQHMAVLGHALAVHQATQPVEQAADGP